MSALVASAPALLAEDVLSAHAAQEAVHNEELVLIDIRSPEEWAETGVAQGAWPVSMHRPSFGQELSALFARYGPDGIAMICATGGRTGYVQGVLRQNGITGVLDVSEGMLGNGSAPGWIGRGLPLVSVQEAMAAYEAALAE